MSENSVGKPLVQLFSPPRRRSSESANASSKSHPRCSVVVCTYHRHELLTRCLRVLSRLEHPAFEVLVVNNAADDAMPIGIANQFGARYVREPVKGLSRARNAGARASLGEIVAYLDDDSIPHPSWLDALEREFNAPEVMVVTGCVLPLHQGAEHCEVAPFSLHPLPPRRRAIDRSVPEWFEMVNFGGIGDGGNMALRRSAFDVWPGFDVRLGRGALIEGDEEHYAFFSLVEQGYSAVYTPDALVGHPLPEGPLEARAAQLRELRSAGASMALLFFEQPRYRARLFRFILSALRGKRRAWRNPDWNPPPMAISRYEFVAALLSGVILYLKSRSVREPVVTAPPANLDSCKMDICPDSLHADKARAR